MNININNYAVTRWHDPSAQPPDEPTAVALRLTISERCAETRLLKENYAKALEYLDGVPMPYDCRVPTLEDECLEIERCAWRKFIDDLHLREVLSIEARTKLDMQLDEHTRGYGREQPLPPFTEENVFGFFEQTCANIPSLINEALQEVFKWLTPSQRWTGCKTSNEFKIGKKVVLCYVASPCYSGGLQVDYDRRPQVDALGNALSMLDGKGVRKTQRDKEDDYKITGSYTDAWDHDWRQGLPYEDDYLIAKPFNNGNVHVTFKRLDLIEKINQAGAEAALQQAGREETRGFSH
jgi:hypothetical protein